jgi:serine/threonine protein kinase
MIGQTISHYKILEKIGEGGMGVVYKAEDTKLERTVVLKFLPAPMTKSEEDKIRFRHEAKAAAKLHHPNICTIHEIDEADGQLFIVMAYIEGETLQDKIKTSPLKISEALNYIIQVADGLSTAHKNGVIHRDIKSSNIMITPEDRAIIMDKNYNRRDANGNYRVYVPGAGARRNCGLSHGHLVSWSRPLRIINLETSFYRRQLSIRYVQDIER